MTRIAPIRAVAFALALFAGPAAAEPFQLATAAEGAPRAVFTFEPASSAAGATLDTERAGVAGSRVTVRIDRSPTPIISHVFAADECGFVDGAASRCALAIEPSDPTYATLVESFRLGRTAHVQVETGGVMEMDHTVSLVGFTRALGQ